MRPWRPTPPHAPSKCIRVDDARIALATGSLSATRDYNQESEMNIASKFVLLLLLVALAFSSCVSLPPDEGNTRVTPEADTPAAFRTDDTPKIDVQSSAEPSAVAAAPTATAIPPTSPPPTAMQLQLEIIQSQAWTDRDGNVRVSVLLQNPYDFPVGPGFGAGANLLNRDGELMRDRDLYFLDGISGGGGFILPGESIAANACFTCEAAPLTGEWSSVEFALRVEDASGNWDYSTEVEASLTDVSFDGDSPIFWVTGTVKNLSDSILQRISARVFVFDREGNLVGAAESSAWEVGPGASAGFNGYGIGQPPDGPVAYEVTALGVNY